MRPVATENHPYAIAFFLVFILLSTFMALNLFIGVIVNAINAETAADAPKLTHPPGIEEHLIVEISALRAEIAELKGQMSRAA